MTAEKVVGAKYVVATDAYEDHYTGKYVKQGDVVTLTKDDGTAAPLFRVPNGEEVFLRMKDLVKLNIDGEEPVKKTVKTLTQDEFDCPELVVGQVYVNAHGNIFRYIRKYTKAFMYMDASQGTFLGTSGYFSDDLKEGHYTLCGTWRKATAEEVAKLEAAEKEHGYVPPLVNEVGTVIEAGKYYKIKSSFATEYICKVVEVYEGSFLKAGLLVELDGTPTDTKTPPTTTINSMYGAYAVPATEEQIALYEAVLALRTAQQTFEEATQAVKEAA